MGVAKDPLRDDARPLLSVYRGDESDEEALGSQPDRHPALLETNAEAEAFWAGRIPAARLSAKLAA